MRNKIFQFLWFKVIEKMIPTEPGYLIPRVRHRLIWKMKIAKLFGPIHGILIGDSNSAIFDTYDCMRRFESLTVSFGVSGTTADDWIDFFRVQIGRKFYRSLKNSGAEIIWDIGGNYSLRGQMSAAHLGLTTLHSMFANSWNCLIPPVHYNMLSESTGTNGTNRSSGDWKADFIILRSYITEIWSPFVIDLYNPFLDPATGEASLPFLKDMVHFSRIAVNIIQKVFNKIT